MGIDRNPGAGDECSTSGLVLSQIPTDSAGVGTSQPVNGYSQEDEEIKTKDVCAESDRAMNVRKPWKEKKRTAQNKAAMDQIEIFEGKGVVSDPFLSEITPPDKGYLKVMCKDDCEFLVPLKVVESFQCVDLSLHDDAIFNEKVEDVLRFPDIQPEIMEYVLRFVFMEHLNKLKAAQYWGANAPRVVFQFEVNPLHVMDLIHVANFLGIQDLLDVTATMVARRLQDVPDLSSMPVDLAWCVAKQFTAQELFEAEEREDFLSLSLGTDVLWEKHCNKFLIEDIVRPVAPSESPPSFHTWGFSEGPPPTSWKSLFISLHLQQLADRQDGSANESFFEELQQKGKYAHSHTIRPLFYEWVLRAPASLPLRSYLALFPDLTSLHLVKLPLGSPLPDGEIPFLVLGEILKKYPQLQILDLCETGFTTEAAILLSQSLQSHPRLQVLRLAYNTIGSEGFVAIAKALPHVRTLKYLDVRDNGIASATTEDAVIALQSSALEVLMLEGNLKFSRRSYYSLSVGKIFSTTSEPQQIHCESSQSQESLPKSFVLVVPLLSGFPPDLQKLQLTQCDLEDSDISKLVVALSQHNTIQRLELGDNNITAIGATSIFEWLQGNDSLLELNLSNNKIEDSCSDLLLRTIQSHSKLQKLSLSANYFYGEENLPQIVNAGVERGEALVSKCGLRFVLNLRATSISVHARDSILLRSAEWTNKLHLLM
ncbi:unnamed protein product [Calypogeia fissa]